MKTEKKFRMVTVTTKIKVFETKDGDNVIPNAAAQLLAMDEDEFIKNSKFSIGLIRTDNDSENIFILSNKEYNIWTKELDDFTFEVECRNEVGFAEYEGVIDLEDYERVYNPGDVDIIWAGEQSPIEVTENQTNAEIAALVFIEIEGL